MTLTKRLGLGALLVVAVALCTSTAVLAQSTTITLTNTAGSKDQDSGASGQATLNNVAYSFSESTGAGDWYEEYDVYTGYLTVSCSGLTPGATYRIGPTGLQQVYDKKDLYGVWHWGGTYSSVTASGAGTVELGPQVIFVGTVTQYQWYGVSSNYGYWVITATWHPDYSLSVARKSGSKYIVALQGSFAYPY